ncbi:MAG TPA: IclR family transcriptional regulator [Deinococcales bacterium]|nr:IclR family transcriptional regulator [Deinococcales bacterium]
MSTNSTVERALAVLDYLAHNPGEHGVRALAAVLDMSPATVFRLLETMEQSGFVQQNQATGKYGIGLRAVQLGISALGSLDLSAVAPPAMRNLVAETGESSFLAVLDSDEIVYLIKEEGSHSIRTTAKLGSRRPVHCTALGKALLASLPATEAEIILARAGMPALTRNTITDLHALWEELAMVRALGYAADREEVEEGLMCLAAPIRNHSGQTVAAVSMAGPSNRIAPQEERLGRRVMAAAMEISTALGYVPRRSLEESFTQG